MREFWADSEGSRNRAEARAIGDSLRSYFARGGFGHPHHIEEHGRRHRRIEGDETVAQSCHVSALGAEDREVREAVGLPREALGIFCPRGGSAGSSRPQLCGTASNESAFFEIDA